MPAGPPHSATQPPRLKSPLLTTVILVTAVTLMLLATVVGLAVHRVIRLRSADDRVWAEAVSHRLTAMGSPFQTTRRTQIRGSIAGRTAVLARAADGRVAAVVTLHVPLAKAEGPRRPDLRLPRGEGDHRFGPRWVQVWTHDTDPSAAPPLLARALALAQAAEDQQTAPWALFAGQKGLAFKASREGEPCAIEGEFDGVPVHVRLDGGSKPPLKTIIVAAFPRRRHREPMRMMGGLESLTVDLPDLLKRYDHAEVEDGTVRLQLDGMVVDELEQKLLDAARIARAFASSASS